MALCSLRSYPDRILATPRLIFYFYLCVWMCVWMRLWAPCLWGCSLRPEALDPLGLRLQVAVSTCWRCWDWTWVPREHQGLLIAETGLHAPVLSGFFQFPSLHLLIQGMGTCPVYMWRSEDHSGRKCVFLHHVGTRDQIQAVRSGGKLLYPQRHFYQSVTELILKVIYHCGCTVREVLCSPKYWRWSSNS